SLERLARLSRPQSLSDLEDPAKQKKTEKYAQLVDAAKALSSPLMPKDAAETNDLKTKLQKAGLRSEMAPVVYSGLRVACLGIFAIFALAIFLPGPASLMKKGQMIVIFCGIGFYLPAIVLWWLRKKRQEEIFLTLPDALDLLVVCVESGLGLDAGLRKVCDEMGTHAKIICEEFSLDIFPLHMSPTL